MKLALGVLDVAYSDANAKKATTTGEVAQILEDRYHVMETFYVANEDFIGDEMVKSVSNTIDSLGVGAPPTINPLTEAEQAIERRFRQFLDQREMAKLIAGLSPELRAALGPSGEFSGAASRGVSHRKKHPYSKKNKARPEFVDTGLYQQSFRAWFEK